MHLPAIRGLIGRRLLVNYRARPEVIARILPAPFRPLVHRGHAVAGICLIRLERMRPAWLPLRMGVSSENVAHRIAVEWESEEGMRSGVYIPRRDTSSRLNSMVGGRLFSGEHHHARFEVCEEGERVALRMMSDDGETHLGVVGRAAARLPGDSIFSSVEEASRFFEAGSLGYSATGSAGRFEGLELCCRSWQVRPFAVERATSSFFDDERIFPAGTVSFDSALLMRGIEHDWRRRKDVCCAGPLAVC